MENKVPSFPEFRNPYLSEFEFYDGEAFITFNIVALDEEKREITVAVSDRGKISVKQFDLYFNKNHKWYFEYGAMLEKIYLDEFEEIEE